VEKRKAALNAMTALKYFEQADTPSPGSPVGILMVRILEKFPGIRVKQARASAYELLNRPAGKRVYRVPSVLTEEDDAARRTAIRHGFSAGTASRPP
jgi:hypothetical protein